MEILIYIGSYSVIGVIICLITIKFEYRSKRIKNISDEDEDDESFETDNSLLSSEIDNYLMIILFWPAFAIIGIPIFLIYLFTLLIEKIIRREKKLKIKKK